jgi:Mg-chelatase subunit ChlD
VEIGRSEEILGGGVAPRNAIAWSARGDAIVVASGVRIDGKPHSFAVLDVADQGQTITMRTRLSDCVAGISPNDVITANGFVPTPTVTPTTPVTPSATHTNAATATSTPAFTPTATPTHEPLPIYLPLTVTESCDRTQQHADVVLVIDTSTSMLRYTGGGRTKLAAAQEATSAFLGMMDFTGDEGEARDQVAIVGFNEQAWVEAPLTTSAGALSHAVNRLAEKVAQGTRLDLALDEGIKALQASSREPDNTPVLILLTDGLPNRVPTPVAGGSQEETVLAAALRAKELGISIYTIGVGRPDASDPIDRINPQLLCAVASVPSMYYETPDAEDLKAIYSEIAQDIMCPAEQFWGRRP